MEEQVIDTQTFDVTEVHSPCPKCGKPGEYDGLAISDGCVLRVPQVCESGHQWTARFRTE